MSQGTVTVQDILDRVEIILQDSSNVRWTVGELIWWLNDAYRAIISLRPDANSSLVNFECEEGTHQDLARPPPTGVPGVTKLLNVRRNLGNASDKGAIRLIDGSVLDDQRRTWHAEALTESIQHFTYDPRLPTGFFVYPPAASTAVVEVLCATVPTGHLAPTAGDPTRGLSDVIKIDDSYVSPIVDFMLYRAYSKDAEYAVNMQRGMAFYQAMQAALGATAQSSAAMSPMDAPTMVSPNQPT